jgi:hypothetical protein
MPFRIKPKHDLGPCVLTLASIEGIIKLVETNCSETLYSASDGVWEVFDEPAHSFLSSISARESLDSFRVKAASPMNQLKLLIVFDDTQAMVDCTADPKDYHWYEHFLIDLRRLVLPPTFKQMVAHRSKNLPPVLLMGVTIELSNALSTPYAKIVIKERAPNTFMENIKANLISNLIWAVIVFILGVIATFVGQWVLRKR